MPNYLVVDIETDRVEDPTVIHVVVTKDLQTGEVKEWYSNDGFEDYCEDFVLVGHNLIWFDLPVLRSRWRLLRLGGLGCIDTLVVSRLVNSWDYNSHSLAEWGKRLKHPKGEITDFSVLSSEMVQYCRNDVELTAKVFETLRHLIEDERLAKAIEVEHEMARICHEMHTNGFPFDIKGLETLYEKIATEQQGILKDLHSAFPPVKKVLREILPVATASGKINKKDFRWLDGEPEDHGYRVGVPVRLTTDVPFNPSSPKQVIDRLWEAGWKPTEKTKGHIAAIRARDPEKIKSFQTYGWTISEENLATLPSDAPPQFQKLVRYILLTRRLTTLDEWRNAYRPSPDGVPDGVTGRIHGKISSIGTWTHRAAHREPNTGNIARSGTEFGHDMRALWVAGPEALLVGCDAESIQLRVLAHYINDPRFSESLIRGRKEDGTDPHSLNRRALGEVCASRDVAKTFIYAWIFGAGIGKIAEILGCSLKEAKEAFRKFIEFYPGLEELKEVTIPRDARQGYFIGLDGRPVMCSEPHYMLSGYLQNGESCIMKHANVSWDRQLRKEGIWFQQVNYVHDEWQTLVKDDLEVAKHVAEVQKASIKTAGFDLGCRCEMSGEAKIGKTWAETH